MLQLSLTTFERDHLSVGLEISMGTTQTPCYRANRGLMYTCMSVSVVVLIVLFR